MGAIENGMDRSYVDRRDGSALGGRAFVAGKLQSLKDRRLDWLPGVTHQDNAFGNENLTRPGDLVRGRQADR